MNQIFKAELTWKFLVVCLVAGSFLFKLNGPVIRQWDESRLTINAIEMWEGGHWLVPTFEGAPDFWNTKPPLMIWLQVGGISLFGMNEWGIRFPSFVLSLLICWLSYRWVKKLTGKPLQALWAPLVLTACYGFHREHVAWTGDYDILLVLTMMGQIWNIYLATRVIQSYQKPTNKSPYILGFFFFLTLAVLTKGIAGLLLTPGIGVYLLLQQQFVIILKNKATWFGLIGFILLVGGYYFGRENINSGYLQAVYENELGGRFLKVNEGHEHPWYYYIGQIFGRYGSYWAWISVAGILLVWGNLSKEAQPWVKLNVVVIGIFIGVISISKTKLSWYDAPVYPPLAMMFALSFPHFLSRWKWAGLHTIIGLILVAVNLTYCVGKRIEAETNDPDHPITAFSYYLRAQKQEGSRISQVSFVHGEYYAQNYMYRKYHQIPALRFDEIKAGDFIYVVDENAKKNLHEKWTFEKIHQVKNIMLVKLEKPLSK